MIEHKYSRAQRVFAQMSCPWSDTLACVCDIVLTDTTIGTTYGWNAFITSAARPSVLAQTNSRPCTTSMVTRSADSWNKEIDIFDIFHSSPSHIDGSDKFLMCMHIVFHFVEIKFLRRSKPVPYSIPEWPQLLKEPPHDICKKSHIFPLLWPWPLMT